MTIKSCAPVLMAFGVALLAGCATTDRPADQTIEERAQARWDHVLDQDHAAALAYYTPAFRSAVEPDDFERDMARRQVRWTDAEVQTAECEEQRCTVAVRVFYQPSQGPQEFRDMELSRLRDETWIRLDGQWWFVDN